MKQTDTIQRFIFEEADIRGEIIHLNDSYQALLEKHDYPNTIKQLLGETLLAAALMSATIKYKGQLTIQFKGQKALSLLLIKCTHQFEVRGLAQFDETADENALLAALEGGTLVVTVEPDNKVKPYQSLVPIINCSIKDSLEHYFAQSEQLSTQFHFAIDNNQASAMLLQLMPEQSKAQQREEFWSYATKISETITNEELNQLDNETLLHRLYHETTLRLFDEKKVSFHCPCSEQRMLGAIQTLGKEEALAEIKEHGDIKLCCEFCLTQYQFEKAAILNLFSE